MNNGNPFGSHCGCPSHDLWTGSKTREKERKIEQEVETYVKHPNGCFIFAVNQGYYFYSKSDIIDNVKSITFSIFQGVI